MLKRGQSTWDQTVENNSESVMKVNSMNHINKIIRVRKLLSVLFEVACDEKTHPEVGYCNHVLVDSYLISQ